MMDSYIYFFVDIDISSGGNDDWAYSSRAEGGAGIPYAYTLEMRPGPNGAAGFQLPAK